MDGPEPQKAASLQQQDFHVGVERSKSHRLHHEIDPRNTSQIMNSRAGITQLCEVLHFCIFCITEIQHQWILCIIRQHSCGH